jgi:hypothetical protein
MANLATTADWVTGTGIDNGDPLNADEIAGADELQNLRTEYLRANGWAGARTIADFPLALSSGILASGSTTGSPATLIATWQYLCVPGGGEIWTQAIVDNAYTLSFPIPFAPGCTLTAARALVSGGSTYSGNPSHTAKPGVGDLPTLVVCETDRGTGAVTTLGSQEDTAVDVAAFNLVHNVSVGGSWLMAWEKRYSLVLYGEKGANAEAFGLCLFDMTVAWTAPANETP